MSYGLELSSSILIQIKGNESYIFSKLASSGLKCKYIFSKHFSWLFLSQLHILITLYTYELVLWDSVIRVFAFVKGYVIV